MSTMTTPASSAAYADENPAELWQRDWLLGKRWFIGGLLAACFALALGGMIAVWQFETCTTSTTAPPAIWPVGTLMPRNDTGRTLILFAHPKCPCTKASLEAIAVLAAEHQATMTTQVAFFRPTMADDRWQESELCLAALANPQLRVTFDNEGYEKHRFGIRTSGHAVLYAADGTLEFSGGVTSPRGSAVNSENRTALHDILANRNAAAVAPVVGCSLNDALDSQLCPLP